MYHRFSVDELRRILHLVDRVAATNQCDPDGAIALIERAVDHEGERPRRPLHEFAEGLRRARARRCTTLGDVEFRDPPWDMLLDLYIAHCQRKCVSVTTLCHGSGVPATTALRHLDRLERHGLVQRHRDGIDHRRILVVIAPTAVPQLEDVLRRIQHSA